jgi:hypothetical protein
LTFGGRELVCTVPETEITGRLIEAELALHNLMTGSRVEEIDSPSGRVRYTSANVADLERYIAQLKQQIEAASRGNRKPILFEFPG